VEIDAELSFCLTALVDQVQQLWSCLMELSHCVLETELLHSGHVVVNLGKLVDIDMEGGCECFSEVAELCGKFNFLEQQCDQLIERGAFSLIYVVSDYILQFLHRHVVDVELHQHLTSAFAVIEVFSEEFAQVGRYLGLEFEGALGRNSLDYFGCEVNQPVNERVIYFHDQVDVVICVFRNYF
jgi:hypothetical protein